MALRFGRRWRLAVGLFVCSGALAGPPASPQGSPPAQPQPQPIPPPPPAGTNADDDFIEFLGADDVDDAAWWEFLTRSAPRQQAPVKPSQDANQ